MNIRARDNFKYANYDFLLTLGTLIYGALLY